MTDPTKKIHVCKYCGSPRVYSDAYASINDPDDVITYDNVECFTCEAKSNTTEVEVPADFDITEDTPPPNWSAP